MILISRWKDPLLPLGIIASVLVILAPMPTWLMDLLLSANIALSLIVLLTTIYVKTPLEFSVFPSLLLATTLGRLVLNVATTRLILRDGSAGGVIDAFGQFVAGEQIVIGLVIFVIIAVIQFVVITKGATRISEVAARFALDGMPGRQMAIDADLNAGAIDEQEAHRRRERITHQADFYGAMDGASKFVRGDAIAAVVITLINIAGGLIIGVMQQGMSIPQAAEIFTRLTIGDGLVSQLPALLISLAAALLVTRSTQQMNLPSELLRQLFARPQALAIAGGFLGVLIFAKLPSLPLLTLGGGCCGLALLVSRQNQRQQQDAARLAAESESEETQKKEDRIEDYLAIDPLEMEIGVGLIRLADPKRGGDLLPRIARVRQTIAREIGVVLPKVRIRDNMQLDGLAYRIKIANNPVAAGTARPEKLLARDHGATRGRIEGEEAGDLAFLQPAVWIDPSARDQAEALGYQPLSAAAVLATHLREVARRHVDELLSRDATKQLVDALRATSPAVVDELIPSLLKLGEVQQILQLLLREQVPIRQLGVILETLGDHAQRTKDPILLTELVRQRLARTICSKYCNAEHRLHVLTLDPELEDRIQVSIDPQQTGRVSRLSPQTTELLCEGLKHQAQKLLRDGRPPVLLVSPEIRPALRQLTAAELPNLAILSYNEVARDTRIESVGTIHDTVSI